MFTILFQGDIFADYFQIYLRDEAHPGLPEDDTEEAIARHLMVRRHAIILHTARNMSVPICVEWHTRRPDVDEEAYQHIVEASFLTLTGRLIFAGLTDDEAASPRRDGCQRRVTLDCKKTRPDIGEHASWANAR